jgi:hypothetical protein
MLGHISNRKLFQHILYHRSLLIGCQLEVKSVKYWQDLAQARLIAKSQAKSKKEDYARGAFRSLHDACRPKHLHGLILGFEKPLHCPQCGLHRTEFHFFNAHKKFCRYRRRSSHFWRQRINMALLKLRSFA